jgi:hypothetical protein
VAHAAEETELLGENHVISKKMPLLPDQTDRANPNESTIMSSSDSSSFAEAMADRERGTKTYP